MEATTRVEPEALRDFEAGRLAAHRTCFELALGPLTRAAERAPGEPLVLAYHALVRRFLGHDVSATLTRIRQLEQEAPDPERSMAQAIAALAAGEHAVAVEHARAFVDRVPGDPFGRHALGFLLVDVRRADDAVGVLESLVRSTPAYTPALNHLGFAYLALSDGKRAVEILRRFVELEPDNASAHDSLADALEATGDREEAIAQLLRAVLLEPRFAYGWRHIGELLEASGEAGLALEAYRRAVAASELYGPSFVADVEARIARTLPS